MAQSVSIVIMDFRMWEQDALYHHRFSLYDREAAMAYPNSMEIHTLELPKLPKDSDGTALWNWLRFISSRTREEFALLTGKDTIMAEAYARLVKLSADEQARWRQESREKWEWDNAARMRQSRREGLAEGETKGQAGIVRHMLARHMSVAEIAEMTGLSEAEIEQLQKTDA